MFDDLLNWLWELIASALNGFDNSIVSAAETLGKGTAYWNSISELSQYLRPASYIILTLCLAIEVSRIPIRGEMVRIETILRLVLKIGFSKICIDAAPSFLKACYLQAQEWINDFANVGDMKFGEAAIEALSDHVLGAEGIGNILGMFLSSFVVVLAIKICGLLIQVMAYGRIIEIFVYLVISPFPMAFLPLGNGDGGSFSAISLGFLKNFMAVCLQGVMMLVSMRVFDTVIGTTIVNSLGNSGGEATAIVTDTLFTMLLGSVALVLAVVKSGSWAKSIMNV